MTIPCLTTFGWWIRTHRVIALLSLVAVLSLADLYMTMTHLTGAGMYEGNPIARAIMKVGSPAYLATFKVVTVAITVGILYYARRRFSGEMGSWASAAMLVWLTGRWITYNDATADLTEDMNYLIHARDERWVAMGDAD